MLVPAIIYKDELIQIFRNLRYDKKYMYWNFDSWYDDIKIDTSDWNDISFVSIKDSKIIGWLRAKVNRNSKIVTNLSVCNFDPSHSYSFGKDLYKFLHSLFTEFNFHKIEFCVVIGNPAEEKYDKIVKRCGGRIIGTFKQSTILPDNKLYDTKWYEILRSDYMYNKYKGD